MWIKAFSADDQHYVYSAWTNQIARISARLGDLLADQRPPAELRQRARQLGLLPDETCTLAVFPEPMIAAALADIESNGPQQLVLSLTEACNFRCRYCSYSGSYAHSRQHGSTSMSEATALTALRWYLAFPRRAYRLGFYGGEPLLRLPLIETLIGEARALLPAGATLDLGMTSNGWLLDDATIAFLARERIDLFVSVDGPAAVHDRYRRSARQEATFARVWDGLTRIRRQHPDYFRQHVNVSMTLAPPAALADIDAFIAGHPAVFAGKIPRLGTLSAAPSRLNEDLGIGGDESGIDLAPLRQRYLQAMIAGDAADGLSRAASEAAFASIHRRSMRAVSALVSSGGQCVPGKRCHVSVDGQLHMCEHGDEHLPIGDVHHGFDLARVRALLERYRDFVEPRCRDCWAVRLCSRCLRQLAAGPTLSEELFSARCAASRTALARDLADYCRARSRNERCFETLAERHDESIAP